MRIYEVPQQCFAQRMFCKEWEEDEELIPLLPTSAAIKQTQLTVLASQKAG